MNIPTPEELEFNPPQVKPTVSSMAERYPKYHKDTRGMTSIDVYGVHMLFNVQDPSGCIQHASKKLLLSGVRTGGKSKVEDIREARDTLTRWLELHKADVVERTDSPVDDDKYTPRSPTDIAMREELLRESGRLKRLVDADHVKNLIKWHTGADGLNNVPVSMYLSLLSTIRTHITQSQQ